PSRAVTPVATGRTSISSQSSWVVTNSPKPTTSSASPLRTLGSVNTLGTISSSSLTSTTSPVIPPPPRNLSNTSVHHPRSSLSATTTPSPLSKAISPVNTTPTGTTGINLGGSLSQQPMSATPFKPAIPPPQANKPNYNIIMPPATNAPPSNSSFPSRPTTSLVMSPARSATPPTMAAMSPMMGNVMAPSVTPQSSWGGMQPLQPKKLTKDDWGDFDPLK
ncbi:5678_t:CDS:1, partial [Acaulospora colombiana]